MPEPVKLEIDIPGLSDLAEAIKATAEAISRRDDHIEKGIESSNPIFVAWAESEIELRTNGNDFLSDLGALPAAIAGWIAAQVKDAFGDE